MDNKPHNIDSVIVAAGSGKRMGLSFPKAFIDLGGIPIFAHSLKVFDSHPLVKQHVVVAPSVMLEKAQQHISSLELKKPSTVVGGGNKRWQSVENGIEKCNARWVMVHDAARPFVDKDTIDSLLSKRDKYKCVFIATKCVDTIRRFEDDRCIATIDRTKLVRVGTPQLFEREALILAFRMAPTFTIEPTDEAMLMQMSGETVGLAWGNPINFKITTPQDYTLAKALVLSRESERR